MVNQKKHNANAMQYCILFEKDSQMKGIKEKKLNRVKIK